MKARNQAMGLALIIVFVQTGCATYLNKEIRRYQMKELRPPVNSLTPGTIIYIGDEGSGWLSVLRICSKEKAIGAATKVEESNTLSTELQRKLSGKLALDADFAKELTAGINANFVREISLSLTNVKVLEVDDTEAIQGRKAHQTPECKQAVKFREDEGRKTAMIKQSLLADADYRITFSSSAGLTAETKEELLEGIKAKLGAEFSISGNSIRAGNQLIWGTTEDEKLLGDGVSAANVAGVPRIVINAGRVIKVQDDPNGVF